MLLVIVDIDLSQVERSFTALVEDFPSKAYMEGIVDLTMLQAIDRIDSGRDVDGAQFEPWSAGYKKSGAPFHSRHTLLHLSGDMQAGFSGVATKDRGAVENDLPYAGRQNASRQFLGFVDNDPQISDFTVRHVERMLEA